MSLDLDYALISAGDKADLVAVIAVIGAVSAGELDAALGGIERVAQTAKVRKG